MSARESIFRYLPTLPRPISHRTKGFRQLFRSGHETSTYTVVDDIALDCPAGADAPCTSVTVHCDNGADTLPLSCTEYPCFCRFVTVSPALPPPVLVDAAAVPANPMAATAKAEAVMAVNANLFMMSSLRVVPRTRSGDNTRLGP